jgi:ribonuclease P protein component
MHGRMMVIGILKDLGVEETRVGIVTSRKVGNAVVRNRVRRKLREIFRATRPRLLPGLWLVIVAKHPAATASVAALSGEWSQLVRRGGILRD